MVMVDSPTIEGKWTFGWWINLPDLFHAKKTLSEEGLNYLFG